MEETKNRIEEEKLEDVTGGLHIHRDAASDAGNVTGLFSPNASAAVEFDRGALSKGLTQEGDA